MARFDFLNNHYTIAEIVAGLTDNNIENFQNDKEFLEFFIYYALGEELTGDGVNVELQKQYGSFRGVLNLMLLDEYDIRGKKLYRIYELCGKDKMRFIRTLHHIGRMGSLRGMFEKEDILTNLSLGEPVDFIADTVPFPDGKEHAFGMIHMGYTGYHDLGRYDEREYDHELRRSLISRINKSIQKNGDEALLLEELQSYQAIQAAEAAAIAAERVPDDHAININNLYYGKQTYDMSGGVLGMNMSLVSWFEDTGIRTATHFIFRAVPGGEYCLVDSAGKIFVPTKPIEQDGLSILPNTPIRAAEISQIPVIFKEGIEELEEDPIENELAILRAKGIFEQLGNRGSLTVAELEQYESLIKGLWETLYGPMFGSDETDKAMRPGQQLP